MVAISMISRTEYYVLEKNVYLKYKHLMLLVSLRIIEAFHVSADDQISDAHSRVGSVSILSKFSTIKSNRF